MIVRGEPVDVHLFLMRACHSGAAFVAAFQSETQQAFLEGHVGALEFFGGVFGPDPLRQPALGRGEGAEGPPPGGVRPLRRPALPLRLRFLLLPRRAARALTRRAAWRARSGAFAAATWCRCPRCESLAELNERLAAACWPDLDRTIVGRREPVGEMLERERRLLERPPRRAPLHRRGGEPARRLQGAGHGPPEPLLGPGPPGRDAGPRRRSARGRSRSGTTAELVATHERLAGRHGTSAQLDHYLDLLSQKARCPGALPGAAPAARPRRLAAVLRSALE